MPPLDIANPPDPASQPHVLHGSGEPEPVPITPEEARKFARKRSAGEVSARMDRVRREWLEKHKGGEGLRQTTDPVPVEQPAAPAQPERVAPVTPVPAVPVATPATEEVVETVASPTGPPSHPDDGSVSQLQLDRMQASHDAELARMSEQHRFDMEQARMPQPAGPPVPQAPEVSLPDPDVDPGGYADARYGQLEARLEQREQLDNAQRVERDLERVKTFVRSEIDSLSVYEGRESLSQMVEHQVMQDLFTEKLLTPGNVEAIARERVLDLAVEHEKELGPAVPVAQTPAPVVSQAEQVQQQIAANASAPAAMIPGTPELYTPESVPAYNHGNEDQRRERALDTLKNNYARRGLPWTGR